MDEIGDVETSLVWLQHPGAAQISFQQGENEMHSLVVWQKVVTENGPLLVRRRKIRKECKATLDRVPEHYILQMITLVRMLDNQQNKMIDISV